MKYLPGSGEAWMHCLIKKGMPYSFLMRRPNIPSCVITMEISIERSLCTQQRRQTGFQLGQPPNGRYPPQSGRCLPQAENFEEKPLLFLISLLR
jgi:hypothetical protein